MPSTRKKIKETKNKRLSSTSLTDIVYKGVLLVQKNENHDSVSETINKMVSSSLTCLHNTFEKITNETS